MADELPDAPWVPQKAESDLPDAPWARGGDFSWSKAVTDIPSEIASEAKAGAADVMALGRRAEMGPVEGLMSLPKAAMGALRVPLSPVVGAARSLVGHTMANLEHKAGEYIAPEIAAKDNPQEMYEAAKGDVDKALSAVRPAGAPVKIGGSYEWASPKPGPQPGSRLKPVGRVEQPPTEEFFDSATGHYSNMRGYGVEIKPSAMNQVADNITTELMAEGYRPRNAPGVFDAIEELRNPVGINHEISDIDSVRKVLGKARMDPAQRDAARRAIGHIDDYLADLPNNRQDIVINPHFAEKVSESAKAARADYAAAKRAEDVEEAIEQAERQAARAGAGGNINNAIRQRLSALRNNKKKMAGWNDEEKAELDRVINGTTTANLARKAGKFAPHGIVSTVMSAGAGHMVAPGIGEMAVPAAGYVAKAVGDKMTIAAADRLLNLVKARSELGSQNRINAAATSALSPPSRKALAASSALPISQSQIPQLPRVVMNTAEFSGSKEAQAERDRKREEEPNRSTGSKSHGGPVNRASGGAVHNHNPSEAQKKAGNYAKTHKFFQGLDITIENLKGKSRSGVGKNGKRWSVTMPAHYGYIKRTEGADGDHVDVYLGPNEKSDQVFVVDQKDAETGKFDEHKCLLGFSSEAEARRTYRAGFSDGKDRIKHLRRMSMAEFKEWLAKGNTSKEIRRYADGGAVRRALQSLKEYADGGDVEDKRPFERAGVGAAGGGAFGVFSPSEQAEIDDVKPITSETFAPTPDESPVRFKTASPLVNITEQDINRGMDIGMNAATVTPGRMANVAKAAVPAVPEVGPVWRSAVEDAIGTLPMNAAPADQWANTLRNAKGIKPEEMDWLGLQDFFAAKKAAGEKVTKQELIDHVAGNRIELKDVVRGGEQPQDWTVSSAGGPMGLHSGPARFATREEAEAELARRQSVNPQGYHNVAELPKEGTNTKYHSYQLPGGENYREHLLTMPERGKLQYTPENVKPLDPATDTTGVASDPQRFWYFKTPDNVLQILKSKYPNQADAMEYVIREKSPAVPADKNFQSSHWDEPNVLAHVRSNDRVMETPEGPKKTLHLEEIQSDWHQTGRKRGYGNKAEEEFNKVKSELMSKHNVDSLQLLQGTLEKSPELKADLQRLDDAYQAWMREKHQGVPVPNAPFKDTDAWAGLALKRMIREAAEKGYDRVSWTPGEAQAARYDLSKQVKNIDYTRRGEQTALNIYLPNGERIGKVAHNDSELADILGKEAAEKIANSHGKTRESPATTGGIVTQGTLEGEGLKVGGEGMREFYDKMLPKIAEKIGRASGVKVKQGRVKTTDMPWSEYEKYPEGHPYVEKNAPRVWYFDITPKLKEQALRGMSMFQRGGRVKPRKPSDRSVALKTAYLSKRSGIAGG